MLFLYRVPLLQTLSEGRICMLSTHLSPKNKIISQNINNQQNYENDISNMKSSG